MTNQTQRTLEAFAVAVLAAFGYGEEAGKPLSPRPQ